MAPPDAVLASFSTASWEEDFSAHDRRRAVEALERGRILYFPRLAFALESGEQRLLSPDLVAARTKNISFDTARAAVSGAIADGATTVALRQMMERYASFARRLVEGIVPDYGGRLVTARTSFRPVEIARRATARKSDDRLLHVDAFPVHPSGGARILRVFSNVDPRGRDRVWRIGEEFADFAARFLPRVPRPIPGAARLLELFGVTAGRRSEYDHAMLRLHDLAKRDERYQRESPRSEIAFAAASTWVLFSDQVLHAALSGQHALEQTFLLPVEALLHPDSAPARVIERLREKMRERGSRL